MSTPRFNHEKGIMRMSHHKQRKRSTVSNADAETPAANPDKSSLALTEDFIRLNAYRLYLQRGCVEGHELEDCYERRQG